MRVGSTKADSLLARRIGAWFAAEKRDLPWRRTRDPYAIWISEAMLQQTRVEAVVPYFARFLARFPSAESLARAPEDEVVAAWSGLGYYRRARALHAAARRVVAEHGGRFPRTRAGLLALPGVGRYTAGAVLSIAFDLPEPLVDGNVARVFARLFDWREPQGSPALERSAWNRAAELLPIAAKSGVGPGDWNQALMELGATVCLPRAPRCDDCPVEKLCAARATGRESELPRPARAVLPIDVALEILVVRRGDELLLERRASGGRMSGLLEFPTRERASGGVTYLWPADFPRLGRRALVAGAPIGSIRHSITRHRIRAEILHGRAASAASTTDRLGWFAPAALSSLALTGMARKVVRLLHDGKPVPPARARAGGRPTLASRGAPL